MYVLQGSIVIGLVSAVKEKPNHAILKWHKWLTRISEIGLLELEKQGLLEGEKLGKLEFCESCVLENQLN